MRSRGNFASLLWFAIWIVAGTSAMAAAWPAFPSWKTATNFQVRVTLSSRATAAITKANETVIVAAYFYGLANRSGRHLQDDMGQVSVAPTQTVELKPQGLATFNGPRYDANLLKYFQHNTFEVLINVFSGRRSSRDNLLSCDVFEDSISVAARDVINIRCTLIGEAAVRR